MRTVKCHFCGETAFYYLPDEDPPPGSRIMSKDFRLPDGSMPKSRTRINCTICGGTLHLKREHLGDILSETMAEQILQQE